MALRGQWTSRLVLALASCILGLVLFGAVAELVVRHRERNRETVPGTMPGLLYRHQRLSTALVRNASYFRWVNVNGEGFRGQTDFGPKSENRLRIMAVGGSTTFDSFVSGDDKTWPARLEYWLRLSLPACSVEVMNAGVPGYRVMDNLIRLQTELYQFQPDLLLLYQAHNDLLALLTRPVTAEDHGSTPNEIPTVSHLGRWLARHSLFYSKIRVRLKVAELRARRGKVMRQQGPLHERTAPPIVEGVRSFERDLASFLAVANALQIPVAIPQVTHVSGAGNRVEPDTTIRAMWWNAYSFATPQLVLEAYAMLDSVAREEARRFSATYLPTAEIDLRGPRWYGSGDPIHFNDDGADRLGRGLAEAIVRAGLLPTDNCRHASGNRAAR